MSEEDDESYILVHANHGSLKTAERLNAPMSHHHRRTQHECPASTSTPILPLTERSKIWSRSDWDPRSECQHRPFLSCPLLALLLSYRALAEVVTKHSLRMPQFPRSTTFLVGKPPFRSSPIHTSTSQIGLSPAKKETSPSLPAKK